ncbi:uncharacterized protein LOC120659060 [Panicum virgatum]|uniref:uncharacterized protein LOC120659060 n=1 Tax=Panicum virgatum TaxID=38727 RepID=UPI0019D5CE79|nr:uncharacterized protein LOC120659060 [Panicum virgatum]
MATAPQAMILAAVAAAALAVHLAAASVDHPVGGSGAWDASGTSYNAWSAKQAFVQGDTMCKILLSSPTAAAFRGVRNWQNSFASEEPVASSWRVFPGVESSGIKTKKQPNLFFLSLLFLTSTSADDVVSVCTTAFKYAASHDVTEVPKAGYDACSGANPVKSYTGGATTVKLTAPGKRYFICSVPGHCAAGMKLEVTVAAPAPAPAPARSKPRHQRSLAPTPAPAMASEPSSVPSNDGLPTVSTPTAAPAPKSSDAASNGLLGAKAGMTLAVGMMALALAI